MKLAKFNNDGERMRPVERTTSWTPKEFKELPKQIEKLWNTQEGVKTRKVTGVTWNTILKKWVVQVTKDKKQHHVGKYKLYEDAVYAKINFLSN